MLQSHFVIVCGHSRFWDKVDLGRIMKACIVIYNMIVEDERNIYVIQLDPLPTYDDTTNDLSQLNLGEEPFIPYETYIQNRIEMRDKRTHHQFQNDLVEHISQFYNNRYFFYIIIFNFNAFLYDIFFVIFFHLSF